ncbi:ATP-binding cassette domain-containing protein [Mycoplasma sp. VS292A]|uniref:ATP-binding cassette domain-containing protein n=1 Tax=Mycoplasma sp. VS292A TaxID=3401680 RepID=UPI003AAE9A12
MKTTANAIEFINISKSFGSIKANRDISFTVEKGTIHALIGENGAGKSTLMSILFGLYEPDEGIIKVNDKEVLISGPNDANKLGIGMVHQHFKLVDVYTNLENIVLGSEDFNKYSRVINYKPAIEKIKTIQEMFDLHFDLNRLTGKETVATQQKVEIMKMLYRDSEILIFDEPTAVLTDQEIQGLLNTFKLFREQGKTILFISHKLAEIKEVADNATILRHGQVTGNFKVADVSISEMANRMVGGEVEIARNEYSDTTNNEVILSLRNITTNGEKPLRNLSLDVKRGEIVAIAGVEGNGQHDLEYVASGMMKPLKGEVLLKKTDFVKEKAKEIYRKQKIKNISISIFSILLVYLGAVFFTTPILDLSQKTILYILGAFAFLLAFILFIVLFINIFGNRIKEAYRNVELNAKKKHTTNASKALLKSERLASFLGNNYKSFLLWALSLTTIFVILSIVSIIGSPVLLVITLIFGLISLILLSIVLLVTFDAKILNKNAKDLGLTITFASLFIATLAVNISAIVMGNGLISPVSIALLALGAVTLIFMIALVVVYCQNNYVKPEIGKDEGDFIKLHELSVKEISELGFSFIPSDRHKHGLALDYTIKENTTLRRLWDKKYNKFGVFKSKSIADETKEIIEKYDVRGARNGYSQSRSLSGGNQQKFIVGREMNSPHDFILILQPTRGLDVGAIKNIHERILKEKEAGKAILLISYELDEVLALADRIAVLNTGEIVASKEAKDLSRTEIGLYMAHKGGEK